MHNFSYAFDRFLARRIGYLPEVLTPLMNFVSFMGLPLIIIILAVCGSALAWLKGSKSIAYAFLSSLLALGGNTVIKELVHRSRPDTIYVEGMKIHSYSFPSGHAFGSTVFYGLVAYLAFTYLPKPFNLVVPVLLIFLIFLIGVSRVYLGAHFPSDVLAAWILGGASLFIIIKIFLA